MDSGAATDQSDASPGPTVTTGRALIVRLFSLTWHHRARCLVVLFWQLSVQAAALGGFLYGGVALDVLRHEATPDSTHPVRWPLGLEPDTDRRLWWLLGIASLIVLAMTVLRTIARYYTRVTEEKLIQAVTVKMRAGLYDKIQRMSFAFFDTHDTGGLINRVTGDTASVRLFVQGVVVGMIASMTTFALFFAYMLSAHWGLTLAVLAVFPFQGWLLVRYNRRIEPKLRANREAIDRMIQELQESISGIRVIKGFGRAAQVIKRFGKRNQDCVDARLDIERSTGRILPLIAAFSYVQLAIIVAYGGFLVGRGPAEGGIALGTLWVFLGLTRQLGAQLESLISSASSIPETLVGAGRVFELLDAPVEITGKPSAKSAKMNTGCIEFDHVSFRYRSSDQDVLRDVSFVVNRDETTVMVGPAGGGKSTIIDLVGRFRETTAGTIRVDGIDVRDWDVGSLRRQLGIVFQDPFLFSNTIENNVRFGRPDAEREVVRQAIDDAAALEFVDAAPDGLDTLIGERGLTLSGGERQRLTLARALLVNPSVLLLDDAMSAVDARTEVRINGRLDAIMRGRTTLIVSHRLGTWRHADRILVIAGGRLVAQGTHDELMKTDDYYRRSAMWQIGHDQAGDRMATVSDEVGPGGGRGGDV